jgi:TonB family protein
MKKYFAVIVVAALSVLFVLSTNRSAAQQKREPASDPTWTRAVEIERVQGPETMPGIPPPGDFLFMSTEMAIGGKLVKGAPYSAQAVSESTQTLSDGNRIVNKSIASVYRDSEGRTRREQTLKAIGPFANGGEAMQTVFIDDPVAGTSYMMNPRTHDAHKMPPMRFKFETRVPPPAAEGGNASGELPPPAARERMTMERMEIDRAEAVGGGVGPRFTWGWGNYEARPEALGKQLIEGVEAEGTRSTVTIPAGEIGNERAIEIVNERWYSAELQTVVMSRHSDPRFGETTYRLTNIDRSEPAKSLFEVPADFKVRTGGSVGVGGGVGSGGGSGVGVSRSAVVVGSSGENFVWTDKATGTGFPAAPISGGVLNGKAKSLPAPEYPAMAKAAHASGSVTVRVLIDQEGNVISAEAVSGHPLLQSAAVAAARQAKFVPTKLSGQPVKVSGILVYTFAAE